MMVQQNVIIVARYLFGNHFFQKENLKIIMFTERKTVKEVEEGNKLSPKFNSDGYIPVVTTDTKTGKLFNACLHE